MSMDDKPKNNKPEVRVPTPPLKNLMVPGQWGKDLIDAASKALSGAGAKIPKKK